MEILIFLQFGFTTAYNLLWKYTLFKHHLEYVVFFGLPTVGNQNNMRSFCIITVLLFWTKHGKLKTFKWQGIYHLYIQRHMHAVCTCHGFFMVTQQFVFLETLQDNLTLRQSNSDMYIYMVFRRLIYITTCHFRWPCAIFADTGVFKIRITILKSMQFVAFLWDFSQITSNHQSNTKNNI